MIKHGKKYLVRLIKELRFVAPLLFGGLLILYLFNPKDKFQIAKENGRKEELVEMLTKNNQLEEAEIIGGEGEIIQGVKQQPEKIKAEILGWQKIADERPNYRDANIKLAILNWKIYRAFDMKKYLELALEIDPNNELAKKLAAWVQ